MQADVHAARFRLFFLLAMSGNFGLIVGQDLISFYFGFALMGLAAYGLVVHEGNDRVRRAGRVYLAMTLVGEVALFAAFVFLCARTGTLTPTPEQIAGAGPAELVLLLLAFGIKAGLLGLHMWLPLAHPAAPVAASAVLSGAMIKAALVGWLRFLPLGQDIAVQVTAELPLDVGRHRSAIPVAFAAPAQIGLEVRLYYPIEYGLVSTTTPRRRRGQASAGAPPLFIFPSDSGFGRWLRVCSISLSGGRPPRGR